GTVLARIATDAKPGEAHVSEASSGSAEAGTGEAAAALEAPGGAGELQGDAGEAQDAAPSRPRRYSPVVLRIAAEHGVDLDRVQGTGRGGRVRKQDVLAFIENGAEPPMHIESPYRPEEPAAPRKRPPRFAKPERLGPAKAPKPATTAPAAPEAAPA